MPLTKLENINQNSAWALWEINEPIEDLLASLKLNKEENKEWDSISNPKRKKEWLAGRLTLKALVESFGYVYEGIQKDEHQKPFLKNLPVSISIAHSYPYAVAILHKFSPVGIDIERIQEKLLSVKHKFLNEQEYKQTGNSLELLCTFWAAKEAVYKLHGKKNLSFIQHLHVSLHQDKAFCKIITSENTDFHQISIHKTGTHIIVFNLCK